MIINKIYDKIGMITILVEGMEQMMKVKEYTIGLLVSGIMDTFTVSVCQGVIKAAKEVGIKLIIFPVKYLDRDFTERK